MILFSVALRKSKVVEQSGQPAAVSLREMTHEAPRQEEN